MSVLYPLKIYFAGDLFDSKDIGGNLLLADAIEKVSDGRYQVVLPQNAESEVRNRTSESIRDTDFQQLLDCDVIVANFDGPDLDSGTVVEFCYAKMVDMPAVLLRTDFRDGGDHTLPDGEPWNLMCSHYPRTAALHLNAMVIYHECRNTDMAKILENYYIRIASEVINALDKTTAIPSWLKADDLASQYERTILSMGGSVAEILPPEVRKTIVERKIASGLFN